MDINEVIENYSGRIADWTGNNMPIAFHQQALKDAGLTESQLERLGEEATGDYEDPRYSLYYATLSTLLMKSLLQAADKQRHFPVNM